MTKKNASPRQLAESGDFHRLLTGLVKVPKAELAAEDAKYEKQKARKKQRPTQRKS